MADVNVGNNVRFTIPASAETKLRFDSQRTVQRFSIRILDFNNTSFRYDGEDAVLDADGTLPMNTSIVGYDALYSKSNIDFISIICSAETDIILFNY